MKSTLVPPNASRRICSTPSADVGVVPLEREVDERGEEPPERIASDEEAEAPPFPEVEDHERRVEELVLVDLEELVSRIALQDLHERLVVVTPGTNPLRSTTRWAFRRSTGISHGLARYAVWV